MAAKRTVKKPVGVEKELMDWANSPDANFVFEDSEEGRTAAVDSMVALCPCKFNCSETESCECEGDCPCATRGDSFCKALCGGSW